jgi:hypothetical protein
MNLTRAEMEIKNTNDLIKLEVERHNKKMAELRNKLDKCFKTKDILTI